MPLAAPASAAAAAAAAAAASLLRCCTVSFFLLLVSAACSSSCSSCGVPDGSVERLAAASVARGSNSIKSSNSSNSTSSTTSEAAFGDSAPWKALQHSAPPAAETDGGVQTAEDINSVRDHYQEKKEERVIDRGSLIDGKYLLLELLHPPLWALEAADEYKERPSGLLQIYPGAAAIDAAAPVAAADADSTAAASSSCYEESGSYQSQTAVPPAADASRLLPGWGLHQRLLLPGSATAAAATPTGAALAAAVVSVRSDVVLSRQLRSGAEGFCVDPLM